MTGVPDPVFDAYLARWALTPDGEPLVTRSSHLLPVRQNSTRAMLKVAVEAEEKRGGLLMSWWNGEGTARVLAQSGDALLLERAAGQASLIELSRTGNDDEASRIICTVVATLHSKSGAPPPELIPLRRWFAELEPAAAAHGGILAHAARTARELIETPQERVVLHGDVHHGNVLDFGARGWLAIDPKGLIGERGFDYANMFCNPDRQIATCSERFASRLSVVASSAGLERERLLRWILAWCGLSSAWFLNEGSHPETALAVADLAAAELDR